ncbi:MAG: hypothetical protein HY901_01545 [Deltaproteobacteria bacterium]|nr:hypothetical protein [Deltaproteobacteria bacterium]
MNQSLFRSAVAAAAAVCLTAAAAPAQAAPTFLPVPYGPRGFALRPPALLLDSDGPLEDVYVLPMRPGQNRVPYWSYEWHTFEFNAERGGGGVRLYFYDRERKASTYAAASLREAYVRLTDTFHYLPRSTIPFVLYASYPEFLATNVFFVSEGTLGATDPRDLRMAVPFFGDIHYFTRVATHEMVHQVTIQKIRDASLGARVEPPLGLIPLWFIEGLAEWGTFGGMDPEGDFIIRDLMTNPDPMKGYALPDFFDERAGGYIGVYKLGQARLTFIAETYGDEKVVELLERIGMLGGAAARAQREGRAETAAARPRPEDEHRPPAEKEAPSSSSIPDELGLPPDARTDTGKKAERPPPAPRTFSDYVSIVLGEPQERIRARYEEWLKRRYFRDWLQAKQKVSDFVLYKPLAGEPDSIAMGDDGHLLVYRTVQHDTGISALWLQDVRDPRSRVQVVSDQRPGVESLHPVDRRVSSLRGDTLVFAARSKDNDHLYVQTLRNKERDERGEVRVELELSGRREIDIGEVLEVYDPALSPDGRAVAFAGVAPDGFRDLYLVPLDGPAAGKAVRLTNDIWSESDLYWDKDRLLYASDHTETHRTNIFAFDLATRTSQRLTFHEEEDRDPVAGLGGVIFRSHRSGKPDLWLLKDGEVRRLTDTSAAMLSGVPTTDGALYALAFFSGEHRLYRIGAEAFLDEPAAEAPGVGGTGLAVAAEQRLDYPQLAIPADTPRYNPRDTSNWRFEGTAGALVGPVSVGAAGLAITDLLRDHLVLINLAIYGSFKLTDASVFYVNQSRRPEMGIGAFHTFEPLRDKTFAGVENFYLQREFGAAGLVRYPIDRFRRVEASLEIRGIERFSFTDYTGELYDQWTELNGGIEPEVVASAAFGYDTTRLHYLAGPVAGSSFLSTLSVGYLPVRQFAYARLALDAQHRISLLGRTHLMLRGSAGSNTGGRFAPQFFLFSVDNLEGYRFGDTRLLGDHYYVANARLIVPVDWLVQVPIFTGLYFNGGMDFGAAFDSWDDAWLERSLAAVLGADMAMGGLLFQLHWGRLLGIGSRNGPESWVFNLNIKYLYF